MWPIKCQIAGRRNHEGKQSIRRKIRKDLGLGHAQSTGNFLNLDTGFCKNSSLPPYKPFHSTMKTTNSNVKRVCWYILWKKTLSAINVYRVQPDPVNRDSAETPIINLLDLYEHGHGKVQLWSWWKMQFHTSGMRKCSSSEKGLMMRINDSLPIWGILCQGNSYPSNQILITWSCKGWDEAVIEENHKKHIMRTREMIRERSGDMHRWSAVEPPARRSWWDCCCGSGSRV